MRVFNLTQKREKKRTMANRQEIHWLINSRDMPITTIPHASAVFSGILNYLPRITHKMDEKQHLV